VATQNQIGWQHLLKGRFSKHWTAYQQQHIYDDPDLDDAKLSGGRWLKRVMNHLWTSMWQVWIVRNGDLHGNDRATKEAKRLQKITPRVVALYEKVDTLLAADKSIFEMPIEIRLQSHINELESWVRLVTPTVKRAITDANTNLRNTSHTLHPFLVPRPDPLTINEHVNELRPVPRRISP
jgi:hypothetical protein